MEATEFLESLQTAAPAPVYLFCPGKAPRAREATFDTLLAEQGIEGLVKRFVDESMRDLTYAVFYADETNPASVVNEAETLPFLADRRVIVVRNADRYGTESAAGPLLTYLGNPADTTILILLANKVDKRSKMFKACQKAGTVVECGELGFPGAQQWARQELRQQGKQADQAALALMIERAGTQLSAIRNAIELTCGFVGDANRITEDDVVAASADVAEEEVWTLTDAIATSNPGAALRSLRRLIDLGKHDDELMGTINWLLKSAYAVAAPSNGPPKISPFVARKVAPLAEKLGFEKTKAAFALCTDTHFLLRSTGVDSTIAMELLVVKLAAPRGRSAASGGRNRR